MISEQTEARSSRSHRVWRDPVLDEARELLLVGVFVLLHQVGHVVGHVHAQDVFAVNLGVELLALGVVTGEALQAGREGRDGAGLGVKSGKSQVPSSLFRNKMLKMCSKVHLWC